MQTWKYPGAFPMVESEGPWTGEPDKAQWVDEATGLDCLIVRAPAGHLCGYVGVPPGHRLHGRLTDDRLVRRLRVHGNITFAAGCEGVEVEDRPSVCHVAQPGRPVDVWWLGFDCMHDYDRVPGLERVYGQWSLFDQEDLGLVYRTFDFVRGEVGRLAAQLKRVCLSPGSLAG